MNDLVDSIFLAFAALGAGWLLGGTWQTGVGAVLLQFLWAKNASDILTQIAKIGYGIKRVK